jgi:hypothetical protein
MIDYLKAKTDYTNMSKKFIMTLSTTAFISSSLLGAGYMTPNGTILYDNTDDKTIYKIEKTSPVESSELVVKDAPIEKTTTVVIEDKVVTYDRPIIIKERIIDKGPVYDIVDATGKILFFGLIYDALTHGFFHHAPHGGHARFDHFRR